MKQKILAWCAAVLIVALVSAAFLRPADENPDFGGVAPLYTLDNSVAITDCEGDTDVVRAVSYSLSSLSDSGNCTVWLETDRLLARTSRHYVDGKMVHDGYAKYEEGMIERLIDGEWVEEYGFDSGLGSTQRAAGSAGYRQISPEFAIVHLFLREPGLYRITHYFRDDVSRELYDYETGGVLYTITHTIEVPEPSGRAGDVYGVALSTPLPLPYSDNYCRVVINFGCGERDLYRDYARMTLEKLVGSEWVGVEDISEDIPAIRFTTGEDDERRYVGFNIYNKMIIHPYIDDLEATYRLTMELVENEDGTGERYTLSLNLKFS